MKELTKCHNHKKDTPPHPPIKDKISSIKAVVAGKNIKGKQKICHENSKSSYHLTGNQLQPNTVNSSRAGKMKKIILPELTCSYLKFILPETYLTYLTKVLIIKYLYMQR